MTDKPRKPFLKRTSTIVLGVFAVLLAGGLTALMGNTRVSAADMVCTGENILADLKEANPAVFARIEEKAAALPYGEGLLWKIEKEGARASYLFGTMHMSDPRLLDLPEAVETALNGADKVAFEVTDVLDPEKMKAKVTGLLQYTSYTDGSDITSRLSGDDLELVSEAYSKRGGIPWFLAKRLRPWALMGAMATPACETARKATGQPFLDQMLAQRAEKDGKELVSLETVEGQIKAMSSLPEEAMLKALVETARMGDRMDDIFETMIVLYEKEETGTVWAMMRHISPQGLTAETNSNDYSNFQREIVDKRNAVMADGIEGLMNGGGNAFVAVGALHLPGETGILAILEQRGYSVSRM